MRNSLSSSGKPLCGGRRHARGRTWSEPTVLADASTAMRLATEETFGPVAPLFPFDADDEAITAANAVEYGRAPISTAATSTGSGVRSMRWKPEWWASTAG